MKMIGQTPISRPRFRKIALVTLIATVVSVIGNMTVWYFVDPYALPYVFVGALISTIIITPPISYWKEGQREKLEAALKEINRLVLIDDLSGLHNRRYLNEVLKGEHGDIFTRGPACVVMIDIDNFKQVNDTFGHAGGDEVIIALGDILRKACRSTDCAFRIGGEEFCVLLPGTNEAKGHNVAERIRSMAASVTELEAVGPINFTVSIGMTMMQPGTDLSHAMRIADKAMYRAKEQGRNRLVLSRGDSRAA